MTEQATPREETAVSDLPPVLPDAVLTESAATNNSGAQPPAENLPVEELDALLDPIRRVVAYVLRVGAESVAPPRYFAANMERWLSPALLLDLPTPVRSLVAEAAGQLADFDTLDEEAQRARVHAIGQAITRLDALLGLPLGWRPRRVRSRKSSEQKSGRSAVKAEPEASDPERSSSRRGENRRGRGRRERTRVEEPAAPEVVAAPAVKRWLHDPEFLGCELAEMGLAPELVEALASYGVATPAELLLLAPTGEERIRPVQGAGRAVEPGRAAIGGRVGARSTTVYPDGHRVTQVCLSGAGPAKAEWRTHAAPAWLLEQMAPGNRVILVGDYEVDADDPSQGVLVDPELAEDDGHKGARLMTYGVPDVDDRVIRSLVRWLLPQTQHLRDHLPREVTTRHNLLALDVALREAHMKGEARPEARARMAFEEAFFASLGLSLPKAQRGRGLGHTISHELVARLCQTHEMELTDSQQLVFEDVKRDLARPTPMFRRLTGEAGSGKGLVAALSMVVVAATKAQVLFIAPDAMTAQQRLLYLEPLLREVGLVARYVDATPTAGQLDAIRRGEVHVIAGTPELLQASIAYRRLGLVVCEESTDYGAIGERIEGLATPHPDLLVIGAIPLPVQIGLPAYAGYDLSVVKPEPHRAISGRVFESSEREQAYQEAAELMERGLQTVVVFPVLRGADALDVREALQVRAALEEDAFKGRRVALFHGAMSKEERHRVIEDFAARRSDVLVATAPLEGCPPLRALGTVILEQADRTSPQRLYRLRGLLNHMHPGHEGRCFFVLGAEPDPAGIAWVRRVAQSREGMDAFVDDLREHGPEAFVFEGCPPAPSFQWLDPDADTAVLLAAHREARALLATDTGLRRGQGPELLATLEVRAANLLGTEVSTPQGGVAKAGGSTTGRRRRRRRKKR